MAEYEAMVVGARVGFAYQVDAGRDTPMEGHYGESTGVGEVRWPPANGYGSEGYAAGARGGFSRQENLTGDLSARQDFMSEGHRR